MTQHDNTNGRWNTKEFLSDVILPKLNIIEAKLDLKADRGDVAALASRLADVERHGSAQAVEALDEARALEKRVTEVERVQERRGHLIGQVAEDHLLLGGLVSWRNRISGGFAVVSLLAATALAFALAAISHIL